MSKSGILVRVGAMVVVTVAVMAGSAFAILGMSKYEKVRGANGVVNIPLTKVSDGKAHFYKYVSDGKDISFFLVKAGDGSIRSAFDACDVCYREKKGYEQQGGDMVCKNCKKKFATSRIGPHATGGCNPSYLQHKQSAGTIVISINDLKTGGAFF